MIRNSHGAYGGQLRASWELTGYFSTRGWIFFVQKGCLLMGHRVLVIENLRGRVFLSYTRVIRAVRKKHLTHNIVGTSKMSSLPTLPFSPRHNHSKQ